MMKRKTAVSRILVIFLAFAVAFSLVLPSAEMTAYAATSTTASAEDAGTTVDDTLVVKSASAFTGYPTTLNVARSKKAIINAVISPAKGGRLVKLQRYNHEKKLWYTKDRIYVVGDRVPVTFSIASKNRQRTTSTWRLYSPATETAEAAKSENITLTSRNIKTYSLSARAACVYRIDGDGEGTLVYTKNANTKRAQASTTKLMTAVLLMESGKINTKTTISRHAAATPWGSGRLSKGDIFKTRDLLYAMLLPSYNDAATAVAEKVGGTEKKFVAMMNAKAKELGLKKTHFCNPHGLDADGHYTTAKELAMLTAYAYTFPKIRDCWGTQFKSIKNYKTNKKFTVWSTNSIFGYVSNFLGGKTGTEDNAGCCFAGAYEYNGDVYITVVLGSGGGFSRWADTKKLHSYIKNYAATEY